MNNISLFLSNMLTNDVSYKKELKTLDFDELFTSFVFSQFEFADIMDIQLVWGYYSKALKECKQNKFAIADYYYKKGDEALEKIKSKEKSLLYLNVYIFPNLAYREYKSKNFKKSIDLLHLSINNIEIIETNYADIVSAKIQQIHNVIRVLLKTENFEEYILLNIEIIDYLLNGTEPDSNRNKYNLNNSLLSKIKTEYREGMLVQIFSEFLLNKVVNNFDLIHFDFDSFCNVLGNKKPINKDNYIKKWLDLVILINNNSLDVVHSLEEVVQKDERYVYFKIYVLNLLLKKNKIYLNSSQALCDLKLLLDFFYSSISDKEISKKISNSFKINIA